MQSLRDGLPVSLRWFVMLMMTAGYVGAFSPTKAKAQTQQEIDEAREFCNNVYYGCSVAKDDAWAAYAVIGGNNGLRFQYLNRWLDCKHKTTEIHRGVVDQMFADEWVLHTACMDALDEGDGYYWTTGTGAQYLHTEMEYYYWNGPGSTCITLCGWCNVASGDAGAAYATAYDKAVDAYNLLSGEILTEIINVEELPEPQ